MIKAQIIYDTIRCSLLALLLTGAVSCSKGLEVEDEKIQVSFKAVLPSEHHTRSFGDGSKVNTLVVAIYDKIKIDGETTVYEEIDKENRQEFAVRGTTVDVNLQLAKEKSYSFVFWAYDKDGGHYDLGDITAIKMNHPGSEVTYEQTERADAFYGKLEDITATNGSIHTVEMVRPLAQINVGTTGAATAATFTVNGVPDTFHPFSGSVSGHEDLSWTYGITTEEKFKVEETEYRYLALGYVFAPADEDEILETSGELTIDKNGSPFTGTISHIKLQANHKTNIAGGFTE